MPGPLVALFAAAALALAPGRAQDPAPAERLVRITGVLLDDAFGPAAGVPFALCEEHDPDTGRALAAPIGRSTADGSFELAVAAPGEAPGEAVRHLLFGGGRFAVHRVVLVDAPAITLGLVTLAPGHTGIGRVRDGGGRPVAGALVDGIDLLPTRGYLQQDQAQFATWCATRAVTDGNGIFRLQGMVRSLGLVRVRREGYLQASVEPVAIGEPLEITLVPARPARGRVVDGDGEAVAGAVVFADAASTRTGSDGTFVLHPFAEPQARIHAGRLPNAAQTSAPWPEDGQPIVLRLPPAGDAPRLRVRAHGPDGRPLAAFRAFVSWQTSSQLRHHSDSSLLARAADDAAGNASDGEAWLAGPPPDRDVGVVQVLADGLGLGRAELRDLTRLELDVELPAQGIVRGRVVDDVRGEPVPFALVVPGIGVSAEQRAEYERGHDELDELLPSPLATRTDGEGRYELRSLPPGEVALFVHVPERGLAPPHVLTLRPGQRLDAPDLTVPVPRTWRGRLTGSGRGADWLRLHWHRTDMWSSAWPGEMDRLQPIAPDGSFVLRDLPALPWEVQMLVPAAGRSGCARKVAVGLLAPARWTADAVELAAPPIREVRGRVGGEVPWSRLAVGEVRATPPHVPDGIEIRGPLAMVDDARQFRMLLPERDTRLVLLDALTGIPLGFRDLAAEELAKPVELAGGAAPLLLHVAAAPGARLPPDLPRVRYRPRAEHWPMLAASPFGANEVQHPVPFGQAFALWLPELSGNLTLALGDQVLPVDLRSGLHEFVVGADGLQARAPGSAR